MASADFYKCSCPHCDLHLEFPAAAAGSEIECPECKQPLVLGAEPEPEGAQEPVPFPGITPGEVAAAFRGRVPRFGVSAVYQLGLVIVALAMVLLPLIYLALVGAAGWSVYWWATHGTFLFHGGRVGGGQVMLLRLMAYVGPLFAGVVVVFFMIKPLLARRAPAAQPLALSPSAEPTLFALVRCICDAVGAPFPSRIDVDCQLNASAGFRRGWRSFLGNDLVLTIGMPLVAGMTARQFAGILGHEFGHFTQGFGMRLTYIIRSITGWFVRVAYERDAWDVALEEWANEGEDWRIMLVAGVARLAVWFSRLILKGLLLIGHGIGCFMLRQMEYDADRYEIELAGSSTFESAALRLHLLGTVLGDAYKKMRVNWNLNKRLPDSFPAYLLHHELALDPGVRQQREDAAGLGATGIFDTHPSNGDRIREARRAGRPGVFELEAPATALFADFGVLAKQVTQLHYTDDLGIPLVMATLHPVEAANERR